MSLYVLQSVVRRPLWPVAALVCVFAAGFYTASDGLSVIGQRHDVAELGRRLEKYVAPDGATVAIVDTHWRFGQPENHELTAQITADWPAKTRDRFWAFPDLEQGDREIHIGSKDFKLFVGRFGPDPKIFFPWRRHKIVASSQLALNPEQGYAPVTRILWLTELKGGQMRIDDQKTGMLEQFPWSR